MRLANFLQKADQGFYNPFRVAVAEKELTTPFGAINLL